MIEPWQKSRVGPDHVESKQKAGPEARELQTMSQPDSGLENVLGPKDVGEQFRINTTARSQNVLID